MQGEPIVDQLDRVKEQIIVFRNEFDVLLTKAPKWFNSKQHNMISPSLGKLIASLKELNRMLLEVDLRGFRTLDILNGRKQNIATKLSQTKMAIRGIMEKLIELEKASGYPDIESKFRGLSTRGGFLSSKPGVQGYLKKLIIPNITTLIKLLRETPFIERDYKAFFQRTGQFKRIDATRQAEYWNKWRDAMPIDNESLINLKRVIFQGDFGGFCFRKCKFSACKFNRVKLSSDYNDFHGSVFVQCTFSEIYGTESVRDIGKLEFKKANIQNCEFNGKNFISFHDCIFKYVKFKGFKGGLQFHSQESGWEVELVSCNLEHLWILQSDAWKDLHIKNCTIQSLEVDQTPLPSASFVDCKIQKSKLKHVELTGSVIENCNFFSLSFEDVDLSRTHILGGSFGNNSGSDSMEFIMCDFTDAEIETAFNSPTYNNFRFSTLTDASLTSTSGMVTLHLGKTDLYNAKRVTLTNFKVIAPKKINIDTMNFKNCEIEFRFGSKFIGCRFFACTIYPTEAGKFGEVVPYFILEESTLNKVRFIGALNQSEFYNCTLHSCDFNQADNSHVTGLASRYHQEAAA